MQSGNEHEAETPDESDEESPSPTPAKRPKAAGSGSMLGAAMLGLGEILEPEKAKTDVVAEARMDDDDDLGKKFDLDFGALDLRDPDESAEQPPLT